MSGFPANLKHTLIQPDKVLMYSYYSDKRLNTSPTRRNTHTHNHTLFNTFDMHTLILTHIPTSWKLTHSLTASVQHS